MTNPKVLILQAFFYRVRARFFLDKSLCLFVYFTLFPKIVMSDISTNVPDDVPEAHSNALDARKRDGDI